MDEISVEQRVVLERALRAERKADILAQQLQESQQEQEAILVALEHQKAVQTQQTQRLEQEIVRQHQERA